MRPLKNWLPTKPCGFFLKRIKWSNILYQSGEFRLCCSNKWLPKFQCLKPPKIYFLWMPLTHGEPAGNAAPGHPVWVLSWRRLPSVTHCRGRGEARVRNHMLTLKTHPTSENASLLLTCHCPKQVTWLNLASRGRGSMARRRTWNIYLEGSTKYCYANAKSLHKARRSENGSFPLPFHSWNHELGPCQKCGSSAPRKLILVLDSDCSLAIRGCGQDRIPAYSYVPTLVNPTNQYSLLTRIPVYKFVGQH